MKLTKVFIKSCVGISGNFSKEQLAVLHISYPPRKGVLKRLVGLTITDEQARLLREFKQKEKPKPIYVQSEKTAKSSALPWFISSRVPAHKRGNLSEIELACIALEKEGMPCPMSVNPEQWVRSNFSYICEKYQEFFLKSNPPKKEVRKKQLPKPPSKVVRAGGVDVVSDAFLQTYEWRKLRMEVLKKYTPRCMCCGATPATGAVMNVDHIKPRRLFPSLAMDINNLQILCHDCNHGKGNWDQTDWRT